jgi:hypothetical protein
MNFHFPNYGYHLCDTSPEVLSVLHKAVDGVINSTERVDAAYGLAGLPEAYKLNIEDEIFYQFLNQKIAEYDKQFNYLNNLANTLRSPRLTVDGLWVNFQHKGEFNPIHYHNPSILSFVFWLKIPYLHADEVDNYCPPRCEEVGCFNFHFLSTLGELKKISFPVDKTWEGKFVMFPGALNHSINPFYTSDGVRITVAGNISEESLANKGITSELTKLMNNN